MTSDDEGAEALTYVQLHKYKAFVLLRARRDGVITTWKYVFFRAYGPISGWHIDCLILSQSMTTAVLRIAKASVGEGTGIKRPRVRRFEQSSGPLHDSSRILRS